MGYQVLFRVLLCDCCTKSVVLFPYLMFQKYENLGSVMLLVLNRKCLFL